jgi:hypothetical protein
MVVSSNSLYSKTGRMGNQSTQLPAEANGFNRAKLSIELHDEIK